MAYDWDKRSLVHQASNTSVIRAKFLNKMLQQIILKVINKSSCFDHYGALNTVRYIPVVAGRQRSEQRCVQICWAEDARAAVGPAQTGKAQLMKIKSQELLETLAGTLQERRPQPAVHQSSPAVT